MPKQDSTSLAQLVRDIAVLALPADAQEEVLHGYGTWPSLDELALNFGTGALLLNQDATRRVTSEAFVQEVIALDRMLEDMSEEANTALWISDALAEAAEWAEVRRVARRALIAFGGWTYVH